MLKEASTKLTKNEPDETVDIFSRFYVPLQGNFADLSVLKSKPSISQVAKSFPFLEYIVEPRYNELGQGTKANMLPSIRSRFIGVLFHLIN